MLIFTVLSYIPTGTGQCAHRLLLALLTLLIAAFYNGGLIKYVNILGTDALDSFLPIILDLD